jgi:YHS domain-containing protein
VALARADAMSSRLVEGAGQGPGGEKGGVIMPGLQELERRIKEQLAVCEQRRQLRQDHLQRYMTESEQRLQCFTAAADRLVQDVLVPRMDKLAECLQDVQAPAVERNGHHITVRFAHTPRFPATVCLELGVTRDGEATTLLVEFNLSILPALLPFERQDRLAMPVGEVDEERVAAWIEEKLVGFVGTYLQLETASAYQTENVVVDPVCGMMVNKADTPAQMAYLGRTYYFCLDECRQKFADNPRRYLSASPGMVK